MTTSQVNSLYQKYFGRNANSAEIDFWPTQTYASLESELFTLYKTKSGLDAYDGTPIRKGSNQTDNQLNPPSTSEAMEWQLSGWQQGGDGDFSTQPVLTVDGTQYRFDDMQSYIDKLRQVQASGAIGDIDLMISQFEGANDYRHAVINDTYRKYFNRPPTSAEVSHWSGQTMSGLDTQLLGDYKKSIEDNGGTFTGYDGSPISKGNNLTDNMIANQPVDEPADEPTGDVTTTEKVNDLYQKYFGRPASTTEANHWRTQGEQALETQLLADYQASIEDNGGTFTGYDGSPISKGNNLTDNMLANQPADEPPADEPPATTYEPDPAGGYVVARNATTGAYLVVHHNGEWTDWFTDNNYEIASETFATSQEAGAAKLQVQAGTYVPSDPDVVTIEEPTEEPTGDVTTTERVNALYQKYFGRPANTTEANYWRTRGEAELETQLLEDYKASIEDNGGTFDGYDGSPIRKGNNLTDNMLADTGDGDGDGDVDPDTGTGDLDTQAAHAVNQMYQKYFGRDATTGEGGELEFWVTQPLTELEIQLGTAYENAAKHEYDGSPIRKGNQQSDFDLENDQSVIDAHAIIDQAVADGIIPIDVAQLWKNVVSNYPPGVEYSATEILEAFRITKEEEIDPYFQELADIAMKDFAKAFETTEQSRERELEAQRTRAGEDIRQAKEGLEKSGMTFTGKGIEELGAKSAFAQPGAPGAADPNRLGGAPSDEDIAWANMRSRQQDVKTPEEQKRIDSILNYGSQTGEQRVGGQLGDRPPPDSQLRYTAVMPPEGMKYMYNQETGERVTVPVGYDPAQKQQIGVNQQGAVPGQVPFGGLFHEGTVNQTSRLIASSTEQRYKDTLQNLGRSAENLLGSTRAGGLGIPFESAGVDLTGQLGERQDAQEGSALQALINQYKENQISLTNA